MSADVTILLADVQAGRPDAPGRLMRHVYSELKAMAVARMAGEPAGPTLQATALVHEAYLKLIDQRRVQWRNRANFFGAAAHIMRRVLVDHARSRLTGKRGGSAPKLAMSENIALVDALSEDLLDLDAALTALAAADARKARVVEMKYFAGMTNEEAAEALQ